MPSLRTPKSLSLISEAGQSQNAREEVIVPLLARGSCHLPGNTWCQDWCQYMTNEHIVFGICCHHPLHPLETWERVVGLVGSVAFGIFATTAAFIWNEVEADERMDQTVLAYDEIYITKGTIVLWSFGSLLHATFDFVVRHVMACACCHPGGRWGNTENATRWKDCGSYILVPIVLGLVALATLAVLVRASEEDEEDGGFDDQIDMSGVNNVKAQSFTFLAEYAIELALAWFVFFFVVRTIIFSGVLGCCGRVPILGGRPRDVRVVEEQLKRAGSYKSMI